MSEEHEVAARVVDVAIQEINALTQRLTEHHAARRLAQKEIERLRGEVLQLREKYAELEGFHKARILQCQALEDEYRSLEEWVTPEKIEIVALAKLWAALFLGDARSWTETAIELGLIEPIEYGIWEIKPTETGRIALALAKP